MLQDRDKKIAKSLEEFSESLPAIQKDIYRKLVDFVSELSVDSNGKIKPTQANLVSANRFKSALKKTISKGKYKDSVDALIASWDTAETQTNKYFKEIANGQ